MNDTCIHVDVVCTDDDDDVLYRACSHTLEDSRQ
jgi:hypothetical protein